MAKITLRNFKKALKGTGGILQAIADKLGVTRKAVWDFMKKHPELEDLRLQESESIVDMAEGALFSQIKNKEAWATKFLLKTKGRTRGYVEKQEIEHSGGNTPVKLEITDKADNYPDINEDS